MPFLAELDQQVPADHAKELVFGVVDMQRPASGPRPHHLLAEGEAGRRLSAAPALIAGEVPGWLRA